MKIEEGTLSLKGVVELCCTTENKVLDWKARDSKFPVPFKETDAGSVWKREDIVTYLNENHKEKYDAMLLKNVSTKRVAVIGRARTGKSFFISRFVSDRKGFINLFCGNDKDKTACPIYVKISEHIESERFIFHSDFNSIYSGEKYNDDELRELNARVTILLNKEYSQDNVAAMKEIEAIIAEMRKFEDKYSPREEDPQSGKEINTYIDTYQRPSDFCKSLLEDSNLDTIEIIDTPGVSGNVEATKISKSDIYIFVLRPENSDEATTLYRIVDLIKADVATSKVVFLYKKEAVYSSEIEYDEAREEVRENMAVYNELFEGLKGNIISTDIDLLNPAGHCILFPTMNKVNLSFQEEIFLKDVSKKIIEAFNPMDESEMDAAFVELISSNKDAKGFVMEIMRNIPAHSLGTLDKKYSTVDVILGKHNRVMTRDNYRLRNDLNEAYIDEARLLNDYFSTFKAVDYPEEWRQIIIKYVYKKLSESVRSDRGLGIGLHPWEEKPARTMLVAESIFADKVLESIVGANEQSMDQSYRAALDKTVYIATPSDTTGETTPYKVIDSPTWNYVRYMDNEESLTKLKIIKECLFDVEVNSRQKMVLCRYVGGLRKIAQYKILEKLELDKDACMKEVALLPF